MKSSLWILTLAATAMLALPTTAQAQYAWGPTMYAYPTAYRVMPQAYQVGPGAATYLTPSPSVFTAHVGDTASESVAAFVEDTKGGKKSSGKCGGDCKCLACQREKLAGRAFGGLEYMHWWNKGRNLPPLVSTSPASIPQDIAGVLQNYPDPTPTASVVFGDEAIGDDRQAGGRVTVGLWLDDCRDVAVGGRIFGVEGHESGFYGESSGVPIITIPFFNDDPLTPGLPIGPKEDSLLVAYPGFSQGFLNVDTNSEIFGSELFLRYLVDAGRYYRVDLVTGYQFTRINDDLTLNSEVAALGALFEYADQFHASNEFHGGEIGLLGEWYLSHWTFSALGKVAYGNMHQRVAISGQNRITAGGVSATPGGLFAQPTNIGTYTRDVGVLLPEANFKLSYALNERLSMSVGYTLLYWNRVALAGDHVDRNVNGTQLSGGNLSGAATPAFNWADTDFWVQTVDIGVSWNY
jgi:hypothetical protein